MATRNSDASLAVKNGTFTGATTAAAKPGDVLILWGTGFGPTNPSLPAAKLVTNAAPLANPVTIMIGGQQAKVSFAGRSGSGLDQFDAPTEVAVAAKITITDAGARRDPARM